MVERFGYRAFLNLRNNALRIHLSDETMEPTAYCGRLFEPQEEWVPVEVFDDSPDTVSIMCKTCLRVTEKLLLLKSE